MKKTIIMAMALVLALPVGAATSRRTTQKRAVKTATVKPHISIAGIPFALTSADKLTLDPDRPEMQRVSNIPRVSARLR